MADELARSRPAFTIPSILAVVCAVISFGRGAAGGLLFAILAIVFGAIGCLLAIAPGKRGGMISVVSIVLGAIGIIAALFKIIL